jgi:outer membrane biosynthesis protein TonB
MPSRPIDAPVAAAAALVLCALAAGLGGCNHKVQAAAPVASAPAPTPKQPPATTPAPDLPTQTDTPPATDSLPVTTTPPPAPPHKSTPKKSETPVEPAEQPTRPPAPQISPQLSADDQASYERKTNEDISEAEKNLAQAAGKQLSAGQQDLEEKIRSFLGQSRDASKTGDWARALNLAQKARLLSIELVNSF